MAIDTMHIEAAPRGGVNLRALFSRGWRAGRAWYVKRRTRYALLELTEEQLQDIGISRSEARREIEKSFYWDANA